MSEDHSPSTGAAATAPADDDGLLPASSASHVEGAAAAVAIPAAMQPSSARPSKRNSKHRTAVDDGEPPSSVAAAKSAGKQHRAKGTGSKQKASKARAAAAVAAETEAAAASSCGKPPKFPTSTEVYHRLRTDSAHFHPHLCTLGYLDTAKGVVETPLSKFTPIAEGGDVPWHRVTRFKYRQQLIWERSTRTCAIDEAAQREVQLRATGSAAAASSGGASAGASMARVFRALTWNVMDEPARPRQLATSARKEMAEHHRSNNAARASAVQKQQQQTAADEESGARATPISNAASSTVPVARPVVVAPPRVILTAADVELSQSRRFSQLLTFLLAASPDVACLQEVSAEFRAVLEAHECVTSRWPFRACTDLPRQNVMILSRFPIEHHETLSLPHEANVKQFLAVQMSDPFTHSPVCLLGVHLTSSRATNAQSKRLEQLGILGRYLRSDRWRCGTGFDADSFRPAVALGDWNSSADVGVGPPGMVDAIADEYASFDPLTNPLAQGSSISGIPQGMDKVFLHPFTAANDTTATDDGQAEEDEPAQEHAASSAARIEIRPTGKWKLHTKPLPLPIDGAPVSSSPASTDSAAAAISFTCAPLKLSDHYPLEVELEFVEMNAPVDNNLLNDGGAAAAAAAADSFGSIAPRMRLDNCTALVILPDPSQFHALDSLRGVLCDSRLAGWMPHVTLAHPFFPPDQLQAFLDDAIQRPLLSTKEAVATAAAAARRGEAAGLLEARFDHADFFQHAKNQTHFLAPSDGSSSNAAAECGRDGHNTLSLLRSLYSRLRARWPAVFDRAVSDYNPHITLGTSAPSAEQLAQLWGDKAALTFPLTHMCVLRKSSAKKDARFHVIHRVPLYDNASSPSRTPQSPGDHLPSQIISALSSLPGVEGVSWLVGGSRAFDELARQTFGSDDDVNKGWGAKTEGADELSWHPPAAGLRRNVSGMPDVDIVGVLPLGFLQSPGVFLSHVSKYLGSLGPFLAVRLISGRHESYVKALWKLTTQVDIHIVRREELSSKEADGEKLQAGSGSSSIAAAVPSASVAASGSGNEPLDVLLQSCTAIAPHNFSPVREPSTIWRLLGTPSRQRLFLRARRLIVSRAKRAAVYGSSGGYLPGISFSILVAAMLTRWTEEQIQEQMDDEDILRRFAHCYGTDDKFQQPITVVPGAVGATNAPSSSAAAGSSSSNSSSSSSSTSSESVDAFVVSRSVCAAPVGGSSGFCDRLMQILTCSDAGLPRNTVRALTPATKRVLLSEIASSFSGASLQQPFGLCLSASAELSQYEQLVEAHGWMQEKLPSVLVKLSRQIPDVRPLPLADIITTPIPIVARMNGASAAAAADVADPLSLSFEWRVLHGTNTTAVHLFADRLIQQMRTLFPYVALELKHTQSKGR